MYSVMNSLKFLPILLILYFQLCNCNALIKGRRSCRNQSRKQAFELSAVPSGPVVSVEIKADGIDDFLKLIEDYIIKANEQATIDSVERGNVLGNQRTEVSQEFYNPDKVELSKVNLDEDAVSTPQDYQNLRIPRESIPEDQAKTSISLADKKDVENAAAFTGGILGLVLAGPVGAIALAAINNYVVKKENDSGEALRGLGKTVLESYIFFTKVNFKYQVTSKVTNAITGAVPKIETDSKTFERIKKTIVTTTGKAGELNEDYDLVGKANYAIQTAMKLSDAMLQKVDELNNKYDFLELTKKAAKATIENVKEKMP